MTPGEPREDEEGPGAEGPRPVPGERGRGLALLGETLIVGVVVAVVSIPVLTAVPAVAAGVRHLRRHLVGSPDGIGSMLGELRPALRDLWWVALGLPFALLVLGFNIWAADAVPGGEALRVVTVAIAAMLVVVVLRAAATWSPGVAARDLLVAAGRRSAADVQGSLLLVAAVVTCGVLVWMLLPLLLVVGGLITLAALAVENRWATRV